MEETQNVGFVVTLEVTASMGDLPNQHPQGRSLTTSWSVNFEIDFQWRKWPPHNMGGPHLIRWGPYKQKLRFPEERSLPQDCNMEILPVSSLLVGPMNFGLKTTTSILIWIASLPYRFQNCQAPWSYEPSLWNESLGIVSLENAENLGVPWNEILL